MEPISEGSMHITSSWFRALPCRWFFVPAVVVLLLSVLGCQSPAKRLVPGTDSMIKPGVTSADEVIKAFGTPEQTLTGNGRKLMFWSIVYWASPPGSLSMGPTQDSHARALSVLVDENNRVTAKHYSAHSFRTVFGALSVSAGTRQDPQVLT